MAERLGAFAAHSGLADMPPEAREQLKIRVLDSLGCAIGALQASSPLQAVANAVGQLGGAPRATLIGGERSSADRAALLNGAAIRYLDYNDTFVAGQEACHPSDNTGAVLAATEEAAGSGEDFLVSLAVSYQVQCRLTASAPVRPQGFDHTTQGVYGAACGVSRALGLDAERASNAVAIAGTAFNALRVTRTGTISNWKGLAAPMAAANGVVAAYLAREGLTGPPAVFEGTKGFMDSISGPFDVDWAAEALDVAPRTMIKKHNAEAHSQTAIEALFALTNAHPFRAKQVERIEVETFAACYDIIGGGAEGDKHTVTTKEVADHSLPYILAVALLDGEVTPAQYAPERIRSADVQELLRRVQVAEDPELTARFPGEMVSRVRVVFGDGNRRTVERATLEGAPDTPMTWGSARDKFDQLTEGCLEIDDRERLIDVVQGLEEVERISELTSVLARVGTPAAGDGADE